MFLSTSFIMLYVCFSPIILCTMITQQVLVGIKVKHFPPLLCTNIHFCLCTEWLDAHSTFLYFLFGSSPFKFPAVISTPPFRGPDPGYWTSVLLTVFWVAVTVSATDVRQNRPHCILRLLIPQNCVSTGVTALTWVLKMAKVLPMTD